MKIVMHIGAPKTGTSSIQVTLNRSRKALAEKGVGYPKMEGTNRHSLLAVPFLEGVPREFWPRYGRNKAEVDKAALAAWQGIAELGAFDTLILSGETFINLRDGAGLQALMRTLFPGSDIEIVCYLRDPRSAYPSDLQQVLKASHRLPEHLHRPVVPALRKFKGLGKVSLLEFGPDAVTDFASRYLPQGIALDRPQSRDNVSMSAEGAQILQLFREVGYSDRPNEMNPETTQIISAIGLAETGLGGAAYFGKPQLRPEMPAAIVAAARDDLAALEDEFGFRFADAALYQDGAPTPYSGDMAVSEVLRVDADKLFRLSAAIMVELTKTDQN